MLYNNCNCDFVKGGVRLNKKHWALFCARVVPGASVAAAIFMVLGVLLAYEKGTNYFEPNAILPILAVIWATLGFAAALIFAVIVPKEEIDPFSPFKAGLLTSLPAALGFGIGAILLAVEFFKNQSALFLVAALLLLASAAHVLLNKGDRAGALLGFVPPVACALLIAVLYFDASLEMNAPLKVAVQTALLPLMLYFTAELRYLLNRDIPRLYFALALISIVLASLCVLAVPVACLMGTLKNTNCLAAALVVAGNLITLLLKLKKYFAPIPSPENDTKETDAQ